jgi:hypothetical protein
MFKTSGAIYYGILPDGVLNGIGSLEISADSPKSMRIAKVSLVLGIITFLELIPL